MILIIDAANIRFLADLFDLLCDHTICDKLASKPVGRFASPKDSVLVVLYELYSIARVFDAVSLSNTIYEYNADQTVKNNGRVIDPGL